jgi:hypothetical protein
LVFLFKGRYYFDSKLSFDWKAIDASRVCKLFSGLVWKLYPRDCPLTLTSKAKPETIMVMRIRLDKVREISHLQLTHIVFAFCAPDPRTQFNAIARAVLGDETGLESAFPNLQSIKLRYSEQGPFEAMEEMRKWNPEYLYVSLVLTLSLDLKVLKAVPAGLNVAFESAAPINAIPDGVKSISIDNVCFGKKLEAVCFKDWKKCQSLIGV